MPLFDDLKAWLLAQLPTNFGKSELANAIHDTLHRMKMMRGYLDNGNLKLDSHSTEPKGFSMQARTIRQSRYSALIVITGVCSFVARPFNLKLASQFLSATKLCRFVALLGLLLILPSRASAQSLSDWNLPLDGGFTCLLYTSPSPRDRTRSRMPSSA